MYLSHKYKFLFLRTPKTASSSLSDFFINNIDDPDAIYTEVEDSGLPGTLDEAIVSKYRPYAFYHFSITQLINEGVITEDQAREYNVFSVLRDPVDRAKSFYYFYKKFRTPNVAPSLHQYRNWMVGDTAVFDNDPNSAIQQVELSIFKSELLGRFWLYDNLDMELQVFMKNLGLPCPPLPKHKTDTRKNRDEEFVFEKSDIEAIKRTFPSDWDIYDRVSHRI